MFANVNFIILCTSLSIFLHIHKTNVELCICFYGSTSALSIHVLVKYLARQTFYVNRDVCLHFEQVFEWCD